MVPTRKKQMVGSLVLDPQSIAKRLNSTHYQVVYHQVAGIQGAKGSINTCINNIIIVIYADLLTTSSVIIANEIN